MRVNDYVRITAHHPNRASATFQGDVEAIDGDGRIKLRGLGFVVETDSDNVTVAVLRPALPTKVDSLIAVYDSNTLECRVAYLAAQDCWLWLSHRDEAVAVPDETLASKVRVLWDAAKDPDATI